MQFYFISVKSCIYWLCQAKNKSNENFIICQMEFLQSNMAAKQNTGRVLIRKLKITNKIKNYSNGNCSKKRIVILN